MSEGEQELARDLGFLEAYTIGLGTMIGAGIFVLPSIAAKQAGPASMVSFFLGGVVSLLAALSLSELATGMPKAGGSYYYVNRALGSFFGSIVGWGMWAGLTFASAFYMIGFGQYLLPGLGQYVPFLSGWGNLGITVAALVILAVGIFNGPTVGEFNPYGWPAVAATVGTVYVSFIGFEVIATSAEEIKNPSRNLPLAMIASVVTPTLMYVGVMFVSTGTVSLEVLTASQIPVADVATEFLGSIGALAMIVGAVLATVSSANASILSAARVNFAMGRDRILVNWLNEVHDRFRTPYRSITATGILTLILIAIGVGIGTLAEVASFMYLITYALVHVAVVVLRRANPDAYDPSFKIPSVLYPFVPILGALASLGVLVNMAVGWSASTVGVAGLSVTLPVTITPVGAIGSLIVLGGGLWYYVYAQGRSVGISLLGDAIAPEPTPTDADSEKYTVVVPLANPKTEQGLLRLAAASAHAHDDEDAEIVAINVIEVPSQTSLSQDLTFEEARVERQQELLDAARDIASDLDVGLRTRAIVGRDAGSVVLDVIEEENADQVLLGWTGKRSRRDYVLGSTIDPIASRASCDVSLVKLGDVPSTEAEDIMVLVGEGPHTPVAARRAGEFVTASDGATLTLANVQPANPDDEAEEPNTDQGEELIDSVIARAGLEYMAAERRVEVAEDPEQAILDLATEYDVVCVGATRSGAVSQALFGSLPQEIAANVEGTVVIARGPDETPLSIREAIAQRLEV